MRYLQIKPTTTAPTQTAIVVRIKPRQWIVAVGTRHCLTHNEFQREVALARQTQTNLDAGIYSTSWIDFGRGSQVMATLYFRVRVESWYDGRGKRHQVRGATTRFGRGRYPGFKSEDAAVRFAHSLGAAEEPKPEPKPVTWPTFNVSGYEQPVPLWAAFGLSFMLVDFTRRVKIVQNITPAV